MTATEHISASRRDGVGALTPQQRLSFRANGYLSLGQVSGPERVKLLKETAGRLIGTAVVPGSMPEDHLMRVSEGDGHVRVALHLCHVDEAFREQARDRRIAAMVASVLEEPVVVLTSLLFNKPPKVGEGLTLHQDLPYYPYLGDDDLVTCWLALDRTTPENGRVEYLPGSHQSVVSHQATGGQQALDIDPEDVNISTAVGVSLAAGEAVLHHGLTVHRSAPNTSIASRMGLATLYVKASAKVTLEDFPYSPLDPYGQHADREG